MLIFITKNADSTALYKSETSQSILTHFPRPPHPLFVGQDGLVTPCLQVRKLRHREVGNCLWSHSWLVVEPATEARSPDFYLRSAIQ